MANNNLYLENNQAAWKLAAPVSSSSSSGKSIANLNFSKSNTNVLAAFGVGAGVSSSSYPGLTEEDRLTAEVDARVEKIFGQADVNNDGAISHAEFLWVMTGLDFHLLHRLSTSATGGFSAQESFIHNSKLNNSRASVDEWENSEFDYVNDQNDGDEEIGFSKKLNGFNSLVPSISSSLKVPSSSKKQTNNNNNNNSNKAAFAGANASTVAGGSNRSGRFAPRGVQEIPFVHPGASVAGTSANTNVTGNNQNKNDNNSNNNNNNNNVVATGNAASPGNSNGNVKSNRIVISRPVLPPRSNSSKGLGGIGAGVGLETHLERGASTNSEFEESSFVEPENEHIETKVQLATAASNAQAAQQAAVAAAPGRPIQRLSNRRTRDEPITERVKTPPSYKGMMAINKVEIVDPEGHVEAVCCYDCIFCFFYCKIFCSGLCVII